MSGLELLNLLWGGVRILPDLYTLPCSRSPSSCVNRPVHVIPSLCAEWTSLWMTERRVNGETNVSCLHVSAWFSLHVLLPQNPDIVLVHYLNVPAVDDSGKPCGPVLCSINTDRKEWAKWSKEELIGQLKPMCELTSLSHRRSPASHSPAFIFPSSHFPQTWGYDSPWLNNSMACHGTIVMKKMMTHTSQASKLICRKPG